VYLTLAWLVRSSSQGNAQDIANTAWSFATHGVQAPLLFSKIERNAEYLILQGNTQTVANTAWAFATLGVSAPSLFRKIDEKCEEIKLVENGKTQEISNTAWSFASLQHPAKNLFNKINQHAGDGRTMGIVSKMKTQDISNTSWAMATLQYDGSAFLQAVDARAEFLVERGNTQCLANTAFAFALIGFKPTHFFEAMEKRIKLFAENANPQEICNALWSITMLGMAREKVREGARARWKGGRVSRVDKASDAPTRLLTRAAFARTPLLLTPPTPQEYMLKTIWDRACKTDPKLFNNASMGQLYQVTVHARVDGLMLNPVSTLLRNNMSAAMKALVDVPSKSQSEFSSYLRQIGFRHISEVPALPPEEDAAGFLSIDMADMERKIAIEYDGSPHFLTELKDGAKPNHGRENGQSMAKRRLLEKMGWKVLNIPYHVNLEMNKIPGPARKVAKVTFLRDLLARNGVDVPWMSVKGVDHDVGVDFPDDATGDPHLYTQQQYDPTDPYAQQEYMYPQQRQYGDDTVGNEYQQYNQEFYPAHDYSQQQHGGDVPLYPSSDLTASVPAWSAGPPKFDTKGNNTVSATAAPFVPHNTTLDPLPTFLPDPNTLTVPEHHHQQQQHSLEPSADQYSVPSLPAFPSSPVVISMPAPELAKTPGGSDLVPGPGYVFHTNKETRAELMHKRIFGTSIDGPYRDLQVGAPCFLFDYSSQMYEGVFIAETVCTKNIDKFAWGGKFPFQVKFSKWSGKTAKLGKKAVMDFVGSYKITKLTEQQQQGIFKMFAPYVEPEGDGRRPWMSMAGEEGGAGGEEEGGGAPTGERAQSKARSARVNKRRGGYGRCHMSPARERLAHSVNQGRGGHERRYMCPLYERIQ